ncbi:MAG: hypothetical protein M5U28_17215 [Sandaracinaceae bacterium]|nr:hypothetical protein [Sandaracinaceae bacterium]
MQRVCLALAFALALPVLAACDGGGGCVIDSDCPDFTQVCLEQRCVARGTMLDGGRRDGGAAPDAGGEPDGGRDSGPMPMDDGGAGDASASDGGDGGGMPCADVTGAWTATVVTSCNSAMNGYAVTITTGAAVCEYVVASNDVATMPAIDGTFTLATDNSLAGVLNPGAGTAAIDCTGSWSGSTLTFVCGGCVLNLNRP